MFCFIFMQLSPQVGGESKIRLIVAALTFAHGRNFKLVYKLTTTAQVFIEKLKCV